MRYMLRHPLQADACRGQRLSCINGGRSAKFGTSCANTDLARFLRSQTSFDGILKESGTKLNDFSRKTNY
ncbi:hypothetical protein [Salibacterium aidingense]|uniref:hypothetical protein n=1 Tax=Salibacterium aidingense TaxID=384933 RepID=UPI0012EC78E6|nr:hypothetical protein [Salibacterium aidingense]